MKDQDTNQEFHFIANRWLREPVEEVKTEEDADKKKEGEQKDGGDATKKGDKEGKTEEKTCSDSLMIELPAIRPDIPPPQGKHR